MIEEDDKPTQVGAMPPGGGYSAGAGERTPFDRTSSFSGFDGNGERETVAGGSRGTIDGALAGANFGAPGGERDTIAGTPVSVSQHVAWLYCSKGLRCGQFYHLHRERNELGREPDCDVLLEERYASGRHGAIVQREGQWHFYDFASTNGTTINNRPMGSEVENPVALTDGDVIGIGDSEFVFKKI